MKRRKKSFGIAAILIVLAMLVACLAACDMASQTASPSSGSGSSDKPAITAESVSESLSEALMAETGAEDVDIDADNMTMSLSISEASAFNLDNLLSDLYTVKIYTDADLKKSIKGEIELQEGDNVYYIKAKKGSKSFTYTVTIHVHSFGEWTVKTQPGCLTKGEEERICACGEKETKEIAALGHTEVVDAAVAATCAQAGLTEGKHCSACNAVLVEQQTIPALGHIFTEGICAVCHEHDVTEGLLFELKEDDTYEVIGYEGTSAVVVIPSSYGGKAVTSIGEGAFFGNFSIYSVIIPASITAINPTAFKSCGKLVHVRNESELELDALHLIFGNALEYVGEEKLIEEMETELGVELDFYEVITSGSFHNALSIDDKSVALYNYNKDSYFLGYLGEETTLDLSSYPFTHIAFYAFINSIEIGSDIKQVTLPDSLLALGALSFSGTSIKTISIPNSVVNIGKASFMNCSDLAVVVIGDGVKSIGEMAFYECNNLLSLTIGSSVENIAESAFSGCEKLLEIYNKSSIDNEELPIYSENLWNVYNEADGGVLVIDENGYAICEVEGEKYLVGYIGDETELVIPEDIFGINMFAFGVTSITIPAGVRYLAELEGADLETVVFAGTKEQWSAIVKYGNWDNYAIQCSDGIYKVLITLTTPILEIDNSGTVSWSKVTGTENYEYEIYDKKGALISTGVAGTATSERIITINEGETVKIRAIPQNPQRNAASDWATVTYEKPFITQVTEKILGSLQHYVDTMNSLQKTSTLAMDIALGTYIESNGEYTTYAGSLRGNINRSTPEFMSDVKLNGNTYASLGYKNNKLYVREPLNLFNTDETQPSAFYMDISALTPAINDLMSLIMEDIARLNINLDDVAMFIDEMMTGKLSPIFEAFFKRNVTLHEDSTISFVFTVGVLSTMMALMNGLLMPEIIEEIDRILTIMERLGLALEINGVRLDSFEGIRWFIDRCLERNPQIEDNVLLAIEFGFDHNNDLSRVSVNLDLGALDVDGVDTQMGAVLEIAAFSITDRVMVDTYGFAAQDFVAENTLALPLMEETFTLTTVVRLSDALAQKGNKWVTVTLDGENAKDLAYGYMNDTGIYFDISGLADALDISGATKYKIEGDSLIDMINEMLPLYYQNLSSKDNYDEGPYIENEALEYFFGNFVSASDKADFLSGFIYNYLESLQGHAWKDGAGQIDLINYLFNGGVFGIRGNWTKFYTGNEYTWYDVIISIGNINEVARSILANAIYIDMENRTIGIYLRREGMDNDLVDYLSYFIKGFVVDGEGNVEFYELTNNNIVDYLLNKLSNSIPDEAYMMLEDFSLSALRMSLDGLLTNDMYFEITVLDGFSYQLRLAPGHNDAEEYARYGFSAGLQGSRTDILPIIIGAEDLDISFLFPQPNNEKHVHNFQVVESVAPTCTEDGYTLYECECGARIFDDYISAYGHYFSNGFCVRCGEEALQFSLKDDDTYELTAYLGGSTEVAIPVTYNGVAVTSIGWYAFFGCSGLTSITIPDSVTSIGSSAFYGCSGLTSVTIPDSVTSIGYEAFSGCSGLTSITIPDSVTSIRDRAFSGCSGLTSITIPEGVTSIGGFAFSGCAELTSITIPDSVTSIGCSAFDECNLTSITYDGTMNEWNAIEKGEDWDSYTGDYTVHCTDGEITK